MDTKSIRICEPNELIEQDKLYLGVSGEPLLIIKNKNTYLVAKSLLENPTKYTLVATLRSTKLITVDELIRELEDINIQSVAEILNEEIKDIALRVINEAYVNAIVKHTTSSHS